MIFFLNILLSAVIISTALWVAKTNTTLGGFIVSLPISTLIILALSKIQNADGIDSVKLAKSIFIAVPATLLFFVPFLVSEKLKLSFWSAYGLGFGLLVVSFGVHRWAVLNWLK